ncbi:MAG TPA: hypothetical protein V6D46_02145 [Coleofasciculaceae cyanobacterium]
MNTLVFGCALLPAGLASWLAPMLFDAPGSHQRVGVWLAFLAIVLFPWVAVASTVAGWVLFRRGSRAIGTALSCLPYANVLLLVLGMAAMGRS